MSIRTPRGSVEIVVAILVWSLLVRAFTDDRQLRTLLGPGAGLVVGLAALFLINRSRGR